MSTPLLAGFALCDIGNETVDNCAIRLHGMDDFGLSQNHILAAAHSPFAFPIVLVSNENKAGVEK